MIVLPDTSIWIDHLHRADVRLADLLTRKAAVIHPFVIGEISLGNLKPYDAMIKSLIRLPRSALLQTTKSWNSSDSIAFPAPG